MKSISKLEMLTFDTVGNKIGRTGSALQVASKQGHQVSSYVSLLKKIADLQFYNPRYRLLFRGQKKDYDTPNHKGNFGSFKRSNLYPSLLRGESGRIKKDLIQERFRTLNKADSLLLKISDNAHISKYKLVRWAMLQHYEVCHTPFLDITSALSTAISFAAQDDATAGFLFVIGIPHTSGAISTSLESETQIIDLQQLCPPEILRPHFQNGSLLGDYPIIESPQHSHGGKGLLANNFASRLIAKFHLKNIDSWDQEGFLVTPSSILFPNSDDIWFKKMQKIKKSLA